MKTSQVTHPSEWPFRQLRSLRLAVIVAMLMIGAMECFAAPLRVSFDAGSYNLPEDKPLVLPNGFVLLPNGFFIKHLAGGFSVETHWHIAWRIALDVSRYDGEPRPVTTYSDPYGTERTFTPRMHSYVWSMQVGVRGSGRIWSPYVLAGPAYVVQRYNWDWQSPIINYESIGVAGTAGLDVHPLSNVQRLFVGIGIRFHRLSFIDEDISFGQGVVLNSARNGVGLLVRLGFEL